MVWINYDVIVEYDIKIIFVNIFMYLIIYASIEHNMLNKMSINIYYWFVLINNEKNAKKKNWVFLGEGV